MADALVKQYQKKGVSVSELVDNQIAKAKQNGRELSRQEAFDEVVADSMESMMTDENAAAFMDRLAQRDRGLKEKVVGWLRELAANLKNALTAYKDVKPDSPEGKMVAEMEDFRKEIMGIYTSALVDAGENFRENGGNKNTTRDGVENLTAQVRSDRIVDQIRKSIDDIMSIGSVYAINEGNATGYTGDRKKDEIAGHKVFLSQGGYADRTGFGRVILGKRGIVDTVFHGNGPAKQASIPAIKGVIEKGIEINFDENHEGRGYDTVTFAAPVDFFGEKSALGVVVKVFNNGRGDKSFYIHEICDSEGNYMKMDSVFPDKKISNTGLVEPTSTADVADRGKTSNDSIRNPEQVVNKKFSDRDPTAEATRAALEKENGKLREDVSRLRELLSLQGKVTGGTVPKQSSVEAAAKWLNKYAGAKADVKELSRMLTDFYRFLATDKDYSWEDVHQRAMVIARHLQDNVQLKPQISDYARDVLREVRGSKITLDESQHAEVEKLYGSYEAFRKAAFGTVTFVKEGGISLYSKWQELASMFPGTFDSEITASDQPQALMDAIDALRNSDTTVMEYAYNRERN